MLLAPCGGMPDADGQAATATGLSSRKFASLYRVTKYLLDLCFVDIKEVIQAGSKVATAIVHQPGSKFNGA